MTSLSLHPTHLNAPESAASPQLSDWMLCCSLLGGLFWSPLLGGMLVAPLLRRTALRPRWEPYHWLFVAATLWGASVVGSRGLQDGGSLVLQYIFIWLLPFVFLVYRPDKGSRRLFRRLALCLFLADLGFNLLGSYLGHDLLGREMDTREGVLSTRMGGLFGHSFYSGSISLATLVILLSAGRRRAWAVLPMLNLALAGSWRLAVAIPLVLLFYVWTSRTFWKELAAILVFSAAAIVATVGSSGLVENDWMEVNESNTLRVLAWVLAIDKIAESPLTGAGYPQDNTLDGISAQTIDESLTAESWYLGAALTYGLPYMALRLVAVLVWYARGRRTPFGQLVFPLVMVDLVYGGFFEGTLFYALMWMELTPSAGPRSASDAASQAASNSATPQQPA